MSKSTPTPLAMPKGGWPAGHRWKIETGVEIHTTLTAWPDGRRRAISDSRVTFCDSGGFKVEKPMDGFIGADGLFCGFNVVEHLGPIKPDPYVPPPYKIGNPRAIVCECVPQENGSLEVTIVQQDERLRHRKSDSGYERWWLDEFVNSVGGPAWSEGVLWIRGTAGNLDNATFPVSESEVHIFKAIVTEFAALPDEELYKYAEEAKPEVEVGQVRRLPDGLLWAIGASSRPGRFRCRRVSPDGDSMRTLDPAQDNVGELVTGPEAEQFKRELAEAIGLGDLLAEVDA